MLGLGAAPAFASACSAAGRERIQGPGLDYQRIAFTASTIDPADPAYAWESLWGRIGLDSGSLVSTADPAPYQLVQYDPWAYGIGLIRTGQYIQFGPTTHADRTVAEIRLAAAPQMFMAGREIGPPLMRGRPGTGPSIANYRFQMAVPLMGSADALGLWRRTGSTGARTLMVLFSPRRDPPGGYHTRIVGRSNLAFSLISRTWSQHGGDWGFTLITEARCPGPIAILRYGWFLYVPDISRPLRDRRSDP